jgi:hypothetical protein
MALFMHPHIWYNLSCQKEVRLNSTYFEQGDVLHIRISQRPVAREVSQDRNVHISFAADGSIVEIVLLNAAAHGWLPPRVKLPLKRRISRFREVLVRIVRRGR